MYPSRIIPSISIAIILLFRLEGIAQPPDSSSLIALYKSARANYAEHLFQKSAIEFRSVAEQCPGSELAIQCEYFASMSDWALEPCDGCASKLSGWLAKAKRFQEAAVAAGRNFDAEQLFKWIENAELVHAKWDRQMQRYDLAEQRLRTFLGVTSGSIKESKSSPGAWLELGTLMLEERKDYAAAQTCFGNAMHCSEATDRVYSQAMLGAAMVHWHNEQYAETKSILDSLPTKNMEDVFAIRAKLLGIKVAKALGETIDVAQALDPVIRLALAGNPPVAALYELAMALVDAGESSQANDIMLQIVHRFPNSPVSIEVRVRLARNAAENNRWTEAMEWSEQAIQRPCSIELLPFAYLIRGQAKLELGLLDQARTDLEAAMSSSASDLPLQIAIRFQLAETLYQQQRWTEAESHWDWLKQTALSSSSGTIKPDWFPVVLLRSAELLALRKEWGQAEEIVLRIRNDFPKCNRACEVDYLLARCLVSKADFDAARQVLSSITQRANATPDELVARSFWMTGETYLMQRKFPEALASYREALKVPKQVYWSSASLLQIAKCCEATQDLQGAKEAYEAIVNQFSDSPFVSTAKARLRDTPSFSAANQPSKEPAVGTKR